MLLRSITSRIVGARRIVVAHERGPLREVSVRRRQVPPVSIAHAVGQTEEVFAVLSVRNIVHLLCRVESFPGHGCAESWLVESVSNVATRHDRILLVVLGHRRLYLCLAVQAERIRLVVHAAATVQLTLEVVRAGSCSR